MDEFDKKREMIQMLMQMLKKNGSDEVSGGLSAAPAAPGMSDGGMPLTTDEPCEVMESELPEEPGSAHPEPEMGEIEVEDEDNNSSVFGDMMSRKKKK